MSTGIGNRVGMGVRIGVSARVRIKTCVGTGIRTRIGTATGNRITGIRGTVGKCIGITATSLTHGAASDGSYTMFSELLLPCSSSEGE